MQLLGRTRIGANCTIRTGSIITDSTLEDGVAGKALLIVNAGHLAADTQVGPFAHLRSRASDARLAPGQLRRGEEERLGERVKAMHLTYLGDTKIGSETNIGAGTITCNYDGVHKNPTTIGRRVFIGSDTALVAPVRVGDGA